ncbi:hypothetical protein N0V90_000028 [Kalmusia sp. IMI 367209]|nr:hypothetical protein N0V90_000028 [Kalmusia sp. IMI 367209]
MFLCLIGDLIARFIREGTLDELDKLKSYVHSKPMLQNMVARQEKAYQAKLIIQKNKAIRAACRKVREEEQLAEDQAKRKAGCISNTFARVFEIKHDTSAMQLLDLPPEIFQRIIHAYVFHNDYYMRIKEPWKLRPVPLPLQFVTKSSPMPKEKLLPDYPFKCATRIINSDAPLYLFNRCKRHLDVQPEYPVKLNQMAEYLYGTFSLETDEEQDQCLWQLCHLVVTICETFLTSYGSTQNNRGGHLSMRSMLKTQF